jgi:hypothetical protein
VTAGSAGSPGQGGDRAAREAYEGLSVPPHEVRAGDLVRDRGVLRTVLYVDDPTDRTSTVRIHLEPMAGHDPHLQVPTTVQIYVRRPRGGRGDGDAPAD